MTSKLPADFGPLRFERLLGAGGHGAVYLAVDRRLDRRVAVKHVRPDRERPRSRHRLRREAKSAARLNHPSIVQIYELIETESGDWIVMEWVRGERLDHILAQGRTSPRQAATWAAQVADGLAEAHGEGLVHRDLKSENLIVSESGRIKILDFGLVRDLTPESGETLTESDAVLGTVRTMSPEQARGMEVGPRADLFALGVLLYEMLTAYSPFARDTKAATLYAIAAEPPPPLPADIPAPLRDLVGSLLAKAPELRPVDAAEVAAKLAEISHHSRQEPPAGTPAFSPSSLPTLDSSSELGPTSSRSWRPASVLVALVALMLIAVAATAWFKLGSEPSSPAPAIDTYGLLESKAGKRDATDLDALEQSGWQALKRYDLPGNVEAGSAIFQRLLEARPDSATAHAGLARVYLLRHRQESADPMWLRQADAVARRALEIDAENPAAHTSFGMVRARQGDSEAAQAAFEAALHFRPDDAEALLGLARLQLAAGRLDEAERSLQRAIELTPADRRLFDNLGTLYFRRADLDRAEESFRRSIELAPDGVQGLRNLATVLISRDRLDEAVAILHRAITVRPSASLYINLGTARFFQGLYPQAAEAFRNALDQPAGSTFYLTWANLGDAYRQIPHRREEAKESYRRAVDLLRSRLEKSPQSERFKTQMALYQARAEETEAALQSLDAITTAREPRSFFRIALAWEALGHRDRALDALRQAAELGLPTDEIERDPELLDLRTDPRYQLLDLDAD